jgi:peroxiredoxin/uncharacterized membrane protein YphA (DoxX/SURF4 family)
MDLALLIARLVLAAVFALAAITKLLDRDGSRQAVAAFGVPPALANPVSLALPFAELAVVLALIPSVSAWVGAIGALLLLLLFIAGISFNLARGETPDCHCFGQLYSEPIGVKTIVRNVVLALVAVFVLVAGYGHPGPNALAWLGALSGVERLAVALAALAIVAAAAQWWLLLHPPLWLADRLPLLGGAGMVEKPAPRADITPVADDVEVQPGLPVGSPAPRFRLPGLHGETMTLDSLRAGGRSVILIFVSPSCGPCNALMPDLARWQIEYAGALRFVLISSGTLEENRVKAAEHGIVELLLQKSFEVGTVYGVSGTPGALIIHPNGTIGSPVAGGADQIRALLDQYIDLLAAQAGIQLEGEGELERALRAAANPLDLGAPAPDLTFEDLSGGTVRLADLRGRDTALLFWRTTCSFCQALEPVLQAWEDDRPAGAPDLFVVLTEPVPDDTPLHLRSRAVLDRDSAAGQALYSSGTPTAVLVDAAGNLASQPAVGADAIRPLLHLPPAAPVSPPIPLLDQAPPRPVTPAPAASTAPAAGTPAPDLSFTDLRGGKLRLSDLHGRDTMLLFWNSADDACRRLEPDLKAWETTAPPDAPELVVVISGSTAANQVINVGSRVVIDRDGSASAVLGVQGTPSGILIDAGGNIAAAPATSVEAILALVDASHQRVGAAIA